MGFNIDPNSATGKLFCLDEPWNPYLNIEKELRYLTYASRAFNLSATDAEPTTLYAVSTASGIVMILTLGIQFFLLNKSRIKLRMIRESEEEKPTYNELTVFIIRMVQVAIVFSCIS